MSGIVTSKDFVVQSNEVDNHGHLLPEFILSYLQDTAMVQSEKIGMGVKYLKNNEFFWVLTRYHIKVLKYPKYDEAVHVSTYAIGFKKLFAYRDFKITNLKGETMVTAASQWLLIDGKTHKMLKIGDEFYEAYGVNKGEKISTTFDKIPLPEKSVLTRKFKATHRDIDFNGHVNNTRYIAWVIDTIPEEVSNDYTLYEFDIIFKKEVLLEQDITVITDTMNMDNGLKGFHEIKNDQDESVCCISTFWKRYE